ncbi:uncharacterized protein [Ranitomeya imitator]|uniref:uncharacterized protein isoform X2 n=1 Tax=Ranitomeya imitator TaxID=111125 RepID=UPI0037E8ECBB
MLCSSGDSLLILVLDPEVLKAAPKVAGVRVRAVVIGRERENCQAVAVNQGSLQEGVQQRDAGPEWIWRTQEQVQICKGPVVPPINDGEQKPCRQHSGACSVEPFWGDPSGVRH